MSEDSPMGMFWNRWEAQFNGHIIAIDRRLGGHVFRLSIDGEQVDELESFGSMDTFELKGTVVHEGVEHQVLFVAATKGWGFTEQMTLIAGPEELELKKV